MSCPDVTVEGIFPKELFPTNGADMSHKTPMQVHLRDMLIDTLLAHQRTTSLPFTMNRISTHPTDSVILPQMGRELVRENWHATMSTTMDHPAARVGMLCSDFN